MNKESRIVRTVDIGADYPVFRVVDGKEVQISKEELQRPFRTECDVTTGATRHIELTDEEMAEQQVTKAAWDAGAAEREEQQRKAEEEERKFQESLHYEERLVAFIDILGWKDAIDASKNNREMVKALGNALSPLRKFTNYTGDLNALKPDTGWHGKPMMSHFSDCVVLSVNDDIAGRGHLIQALSVLSHSLPHLGFFLRGGIVRGEIYHENGLAFGPALVDAYNLEKAATYPRIVLSEELAKEEEDNLLENANTPWRKDRDGVLFFDFLPKIMGNYIQPNDPMLWAMLLNPVKDLIIKKLAEFRDDENVFAKYEWLKFYFNTICEEISSCGVTPITDNI